MLQTFINILLKSTHKSFTLQQSEEWRKKESINKCFDILPKKLNRNPTTNENSSSFQSFSSFFPIFSAQILCKIFENPKKWNPLDTLWESKKRSSYLHSPKQLFRNPEKKILLKILCCLLFLETILHKKKLLSPIFKIKNHPPLILHYSQAFIAFYTHGPDPFILHEWPWSLQQLLLMWAFWNLLETHPKFCVRVRGWKTQTLSATISDFCCWNSWEGNGVNVPD